MSTTRERREARADRLDEWAGKREAKSEGMFAVGEVNMEGTPLLPGHHSYRRHLNAIEKANAATRRAIANSDKAEGMRSKAANIRAAADSAIYSDDENATGALEARIVERETARDAMKARNVEFRKANAAALKAMTPFARGQALPHPPYELTNLGATIRRDRARLADLRAAPPGDGLVHSIRPSGEPRPGARALCGADHRHGVMTTYAPAHVTCEACRAMVRAEGGS